MCIRDSNRSVAEHAVAMIFALSKNLIEAQNEMCKGNWEIRGAKKAFELEGLLKEAVVKATFEAPLRHNSVETFDEYNTCLLYTSRCV